MKTRLQVNVKENRIQKVSTVILFLIILVLGSLSAVYAVPSGPSVTVLSNSTAGNTPGTLVSSTINGTISPGGYIFTTTLTGTQQNTKWKAYVGNVTGTLTLDDASTNTIFAWTLTTVSGEVYASRALNINWTGINCTWIGDGYYNASAGRVNSNRTPEHNENKFLSHTGPSDNVSATFFSYNHSAMTIGSIRVGKNECFSAQTRQRDVVQAFTDSDNANFTEILLYDGALNKTSGNLIYASFIYQDANGYTLLGTNETYDFQMIVPESGAPGFSSSTGYYFYVELS